jgi:hypothetical protein
MKKVSSRSRKTLLPCFFLTLSVLADVQSSKGQFRSWRLWTVVSGDTEEAVGCITNSQHVHHAFDLEQPGSRTLAEVAAAEPT